MAKMTVEDTSLTAVADAIRDRTMNDRELLFPDGFVESIGSLKRAGVPWLTPMVDGTLQEVTEEMLEGCTVLYDYAFRNRKITKITVPEAITSINGYAFYSCQFLEEIVMKSPTPPPLADTALGMTTRLARIIVPKGSLSAYQSATNWSNKADIMVEAIE